MQFPSLNGRANTSFCNSKRIHCYYLTPLHQEWLPSHDDTALGIEVDYCGGRKTRNKTLRLRSTPAPPGASDDQKQRQKQKH